MNFRQRAVKMLGLIVGLIAEFLLVAEAVTSLTGKRVAIESNTVQHCKDTSCKCGASYGDSRTFMCNQVCQGPKCKEITCSAKNCFQICDNCHMKCTSDVGYCRQKCLSGACTFTCNAKQCKQDCNGKKCHETPKDISVGCSVIIIPRFYLVILAILFATTSILSFVLLVTFYGEPESWSSRKSGGYVRLQSVHGYLIQAELL